MVAPSVQTVLKIPTDITSGQREISTLTAWNGDGCPQIYETDDSHGVFLMEYLHQSPQPITAQEAYQLFQRKNLIQPHDGLKTIDPYACIGDPTFDAAFWLALAHHDKPLEENLNAYPAAKESNDYNRFFCWTWAISVIENRPYEKQGTQERQHFINTQRKHAHQAAELI